MTGRGAFDNNESGNVDTQEVIARETERKGRMVPSNAHHGGTPADQPPVAWGVGQPLRPQTTTMREPSRARPGIARTSASRRRSRRAVTPEARAMAAATTCASPRWP